MPADNQTPLNMSPALANRFSALPKQYTGTPPDTTIGIRPRETVRLTNSRKVQLTHELAMKILETTEVPGDRGLRKAQVDKIIMNMRRNTFRYETVSLATAVCRENGVEYRENGQHTCQAALALPADFPHEKVNLLTYECDTLEDVRTLYGTFDQNAVRTKSNVVISQLKGTSQFQGVSDRIIRTLTAGVSVWQWDTGAKRSAHDGEDVAYLIQKDHAVTVNRVVEFVVANGGFTSEGSKFMDRSSVYAALLETFGAVPTKAPEFWNAVATGARLEDHDPRLKLRNTLMVTKLHNANAKVKGQAGRSAGTEEMYRWCVHAWNAWRKGEKLRQLKTSTDTPRPKAR